MNKLELDGLFNEQEYLKKDIIGEYTDDDGNVFKYCLEDGVNFYHYLYIYNEKIDKIIENGALIDYDNSYENGIYGKDEYYGDIVIENDNSIVIMIKDLKKEIEDYDYIEDFILYTIDDCIYLKTEETEEDERIEKIKKFVEADTHDYNRALVINQNNEYEERYSFNRVVDCLDETDKELIAVSQQNWNYLTDICDNCCYDTMNEETDETYCSDNQNKIDCIVNDILSENEYFNEYLTDLKRAEELKRIEKELNKETKF